MSMTETDDSKTEPAPTTPQIKGKFVISEPAFVIDDKGNAWWIDPRSQILKRVVG